MAGAMPQAGKGLREPVAQRACFPQTRVYPPYAAKALFKMKNFPDRLLGFEHVYFSSSGAEAS